MTVPEPNNGAQPGLLRTSVAFRRDKGMVGFDYFFEKRKVLVGEGRRPSSTTGEWVSYLAKIPIIADNVVD